MTLNKIGAALAACVISALLNVSAQAEIFAFSYTFDASTRGTPGHVLAGVVEGTLMEDGDTVLIDNILTASLAGMPYNIIKKPGIRAALNGDTPTMSLSGNSLDFWVCVQGFTTEAEGGGGDCPFGTEGGFLVSHDWPSPGATGAWAGIPELGASYRDGDIPLNAANWHAEAVTHARVQFSYTFDANVRGTAGHVLEGELDGILMADRDTIQVLGLRKATLAGHKYKLDKHDVGIRAADTSQPPRISLSGNTLDLWVCPQGFTTTNGDGGDCPFGAEGGFLMSQNWPNPGDNGAWAGIPKLGNSYRDGDIPMNLANWQADIKPTKNQRATCKKSKLRGGANIGTISTNDCVFDNGSVDQYEDLYKLSQRKLGSDAANTMATFSLNAPGFDWIFGIGGESKDIFPEPVYAFRRGAAGVYDFGGFFVNTFSIIGESDKYEMWVGGQNPEQLGGYTLTASTEPVDNSCNKSHRVYLQGNVSFSSTISNETACRGTVEFGEFVGAPINYQYWWVTVEAGETVTLTLSGVEHETMAAAIIDFGTGAAALDLGDGPGDTSRQVSFTTPERTTLYVEVSTVPDVVSGYQLTFSN